MNSVKAISEVMFWFCASQNGTTEFGATIKFCVKFDETVYVALKKNVKTGQRGIFVILSSSFSMLGRQKTH